MTGRARPEEAAISVQRALLNCVGPGAAAALGLAQARLAWLEVVESAGLASDELHSRLVSLDNGMAAIEANESILAQELTLRERSLVEAVNERQAGRPGAIFPVRRLTVTVRPGATRPG